MKDIIGRIVEELNTNKNVKKFNVHAFDSGAFMIEIWVRKEFYRIQLSNDTFGLSKINNDNSLGTIPDELFPSYEEFIVNLLYAINSPPRIVGGQGKTNKTQKNNIWQKISDWRIWDCWDI